VSCQTASAILILLGLVAQLGGVAWILLSVGFGERLNQIAVDLNAPELLVFGFGFQLAGAAVLFAY
jgi:hypothetical protein